MCELDGYLVATDGSGDVIEKLEKSEHFLLPNPLPFGVLEDYERKRRSVLTSESTHNHFRNPCGDSSNLEHFIMCKRVGVERGGCFKDTLL